MPGPAPPALAQLRVNESSSGEGGSGSDPASGSQSPKPGATAPSHERLSAGFPGASTHCCWPQTHLRWTPRSSSPAQVWPGPEASVTFWSFLSLPKQALSITTHEPVHSDDGLGKLMKVKGRGWRDGDGDLESRQEVPRLSAGVCSFMIRPDVPSSAEQPETLISAR